MEPFDPRWDFESLVLELNQQHRPGSVTSGKARNVLIQAWALCVGRARAVAELRATIKRHGSRSAAARILQMRTTTLGELADFFATVPETSDFPKDAETLRQVLESLPPDSRADFLAVGAELLKDKDALRRLAASPILPQLTSAIGPALRSMDIRLAVDELRNNLSTGKNDEQTYQDWCERHSWAFGNAYVVRDDVRRLDSANTVDLLLPNIVGYRDIVELKRPDVSVLGWDRSHKSYYFSASCSRAIGQAHKYMDRLHEVAREGLDQHPNLLAYHPHAIVVIGRSNDWGQAKTRSLRGLNERLHGVTVMTYDHLLAQAAQVLTTMTA